MTLQRGYRKLAAGEVTRKKSIAIDAASRSSCPAELHDARPATDALLLLYRRRDECAALHGCGDRACAIAREWPAQDAAANPSGWLLFAFIALAFAGPGYLR